jgi:hypothetical protein
MSDVFYDFRLYIPVDGRNDVEQLQTKIEDFVEENDYPFEFEPLKRDGKDTLSVELVVWDTAEDVDPLLEDLYGFVLSSFDIRIEGTIYYEAESSRWLGEFDNDGSIRWFDLSKFEQFSVSVLEELVEMGEEISAPNLIIQCPNCQAKAAVDRVFNGTAYEFVVDKAGMLTTDRYNIELGSGDTEYRCSQCEEVIAANIDELSRLIKEGKLKRV